MSKIIKVEYIIIGNGIAGLSAAKEIRENDINSSILLISSEKNLSYYRVKLSHYISKEFNDNEILIKDEKWYKDNNIETVLDTVVENIYIHNNILTLKNGGKLEYSKLLVATGSRPFIPPIEGSSKDGVFTLRTLKDLKHIKKYFSLCENITVIGGGLLGLEAAWAIKELGKKVSVVEFSPHLCPRQIDIELSHVLKNKLEEEGLNIYLESQTKEILGQSRVEGIKLKNKGSFKTDGVLISAGIRPNIDIIKDTNISSDKGIIVNNRMKTNIDNIYAAGDVIEVEGKVIGLWNNASEQGSIAGINMSGGNKEYKFKKPFAALNIGNIKLFSIGDVKGFDKTLYDYDSDKDAHYKLFIKDNKIIGGVLFGDNSKMLKVKKAVIDNVDIKEHLDKDLSLNEILESL